MNQKRWLALLLFLGVVALVVVGLGRLGFREAGRTWRESTLYGTGEKVLLLELKGSIPTGKALEDLLSQVRQAREDESVRAVVLLVDSPGGGVTETEAIHRSLKALAEAKPLVAALGSVAASGGYYAATAAQEIFSPPTALTGSIGVISVIPEVSGLLEKLGLRVEVLKEGALKDMASGLKPLTPEEKAVLKAYMREAYELFVRRVAEGRNLPLERVRALADGRIYSGQQAVALGLVDREGYLEDAAQRAAELAGLSTFRLVRYEKPKSLLQELIGEENPLGLGEAEALLGLLSQSRFRLEYRYLGGGLW
ncbi:MULTISPECIES: signal peptide peptidase SppA [Thermus]|jgi:protease-4|uniref:Protease n=1 Tax=Thermus brockianus TaxID=56956 RepID=A0A1J0LSV5_THEBO|nr:signal peptide peptidase SppA [Thermus brockianus]APD08795.1 protease [Thermus brockianus]BDG15835.1 protease [Thermus brockianus]